MAWLVYRLKDGPVECTVARHVKYV